MANLIELLNETLGDYSPDNPIKEISGWKFFPDPDGFLPAANNLTLVAKIFAWKDKDSKFYATCVGNESSDGVGSYKYGDELNTGFVSQCKINWPTLKSFIPADGSYDELLGYVKSEVAKSVERLVIFVKEREHLL